MREIKLRGFSKSLNSFIYGAFIDASDANCLNLSAFFRRELNGDIDAETIMQFTGLHDKNGVEIYEGDVVKTWHDDDISYDDNDNEIVVEYITTVVRDFNIIEVHNCEWDIWTLQFASEAGHNFEVIGNIYENSDLLEQK